MEDIFVNPQRKQARVLEMSHASAISGVPGIAPRID
jgi:hypothetical protein